MGDKLSSLEVILQKLEHLEQRMAAKSRLNEQESGFLSSAVFGLSPLRDSFWVLIEVLMEMEIPMVADRQRAAMRLRGLDKDYCFEQANLVVFRRFIDELQC